MFLLSNLSPWETDMLLADSVEIVSPNLLSGVIGSVIFVAIGMVMLVLIKPLLWRMADKMTPGNLDEQLVPANGKAPNVALAIVVGAVIGTSILGMAIIIAASIH